MWHRGKLGARVPDSAGAGGRREATKNKSFLKHETADLHADQGCTLSDTADRFRKTGTVTVSINWLFLQGPPGQC